MDTLWFHSKKKKNFNEIFLLFLVCHCFRTLVVMVMLTSLISVVGRLILCFTLLSKLKRVCVFCFYFDDMSMDIVLLWLPISLTCVYLQYLCWVLFVCFFVSYFPNDFVKIDFYRFELIIQWNLCVYVRWGGLNRKFVTFIYWIITRKKLKWQWLVNNACH